MRLPLLLCTLCLLAGLGGCVDAQEAWVFDESGGGTYSLQVAWNADLWRRVGDVLGPRVMQRLQARPFPLRTEQWADGLRGLQGVTVEALSSDTDEAGRPRLSVRLAFQRLEDVLRWEPLARRTVRVTRPKETAKEPAVCKFYMEPIARVPVLDRLAALLEAAEKPPPKAEGAAAARDPAPLERFGLDAEAAALVWRMVKLPLEKVRLQTSVQVPGVIERVAGRAVATPTRRIERRWSFQDLRTPATDRTVRFAWRLRTLDQPPLVNQAGDRDPRPAGPTGSSD